MALATTFQPETVRREFDILHSDLGRIRNDAMGLLLAVGTSARKEARGTFAWLAKRLAELARGPAYVGCLATAAASRWLMDRNPGRNGEHAGDVRSLP